jgi:hypothetical protein
MRPNYQAAIEFLRLWAPDGPWILTAIQVDRKGIETKTFKPGDEAELLAWLEDQGATRNLYFHVNPATRDLTKKAERTDVKALAWLHVDIDPRAGEDLAEEQARALETLRRRLPPDVPPPTVIVFSGGGYQGFWKLREPVPIDGDLEKAEDAARYNLQLELLFGADECHNVDRIMRLPGTLNRPNKRKRDKGQRIALAEVVEFEPERVYDVGQFVKALKVQEPDEGFAADRLQAPGNVARLDSVEDLPENVPDWCRVLIVQGHDPEDPEKWGGDRSRALFAVVCELDRCGVPADVIYSVITDPGFLISESVLDKGTQVERYALRQIERAREENVNPTLRILNERHAVIANWGGDCCVIEEQHDPVMKRSRLTSQSFANFKKRYDNQRVQVGVDANDNPRTAPMGSWWLSQGMRRQYDTVVFAPGRDVEGSYNLWRGFAYDARPGDCSLFLAHVRNVVCGGNEDHYRYLMRYLARAVQCPGEPGYASIVLRGKEGVGKGFFVTRFGRLFGRHFVQVTSAKHLVGNFNFHLWDCVVLFADEAFRARDKQAEAILKTIVTEETLQIEKKGKDTITAPNFLHVFMASNEEWVIPAGYDDRRFFVLDVSDAHQKDYNYFGAIDAQLEDGGYAALLHHLLTYDVGEFNVRDIPETEALKTQKELSLGSAEDWWMSKLLDGRLDDSHEEWGPRILRENLLYDFTQHVAKFGGRGKTSEISIRRFLSRVMPGHYPRRKQGSQPAYVKQLDGSEKTATRPYYYYVPPLQACRDYWDEHFGGPYDWPEVEVVDDVEPGEDAF